VDDEGNDEIRVHVRRPRTFTAYQYDPEKALAKVLRALKGGNKKTFLRELAKDINRDLGATKLKTSYGTAEYEGEGPSVQDENGTVENSPEFSGSYRHGSGAVPGKKLSGADRKRLGERDDEELDTEARIGSRHLGKDKEGRTFADAQEAFAGTWEQDQEEVKKREAEERKVWRKTVSASN